MNYRQFFDSLSSLIFPPLCLHCKETLPEALKLLCFTCLSQVECIDTSQRCSRCFAEGCICAKSPPISYTRLGCCFEYEGPQKSLLVAFKYKDRPYLAKSLAGFLLLQHQQLAWQPPDYITYIPQSFLRSCIRGYNQSALLAHHLAEMMQKPVICPLKRTSFSVSQTLLPKEQRKLLGTDIFTCKKSHDLSNKRLLLIDDVYTTGATAERASLALQALEPASVDVLCLMRTEL